MSYIIGYVLFLAACALVIWIFYSISFANSVAKEKKSENAFEARGPSNV